MGTLTPIVLRYVTDRTRVGDIEPCTLRNIRNHLLDFADNYGARPIDKLGRAAVERWIGSMNKREIAKSTQTSRLSSLRGFGRWCKRHKICDNFMFDAPKVRRPRAVARDITNDHIVALLEVARTDRERLLVWLMYGCALRCIEVHRLDIEDYEQCTLYVVGKGKRERKVPTIPPVDRAIAAYLTSTGHGSGALVRYTNGTNRLGSSRIGGIVGRLIRDAGLKIRPYDGRSAHGLRAAAASDLADNTDDLREVQELLGHADFQSLNPYVRRATLERLREAQARRPFAA